jgi:hypothetical protein
MTFSGLNLSEDYAFRHLWLAVKREQSIKGKKGAFLIKIKKYEKGFAS